jgi:hypothetical protein
LGDCTGFSSNWDGFYTDVQGVAIVDVYRVFIGEDYGAVFAIALEDCRVFSGFSVRVRLGILFPWDVGESCGFVSPQDVVLVSFGYVWREVIENYVYWKWVYSCSWI